jgi:hypothetical protein
LFARVPLAHSLRVRPRAILCIDSQAWNLGRIIAGMEQDPKVTLDWALRCLERSLQNLGDGWAERRVRRQFHQLLLAVERDAHAEADDANEGAVARESA